MQIPFSKYLLRFDGTFAEVTAKKPPTVVWKYRDDTVFTTWEVSFNALSPTAQELLLLLGFFDNQSIPEELLSLEGLNNGFGIGKHSFLSLHLVRRSRLYSNRRLQTRLMMPLERYFPSPWLNVRTLTLSGFIHWSTHGRARGWIKATREERRCTQSRWSPHQFHLAMTPGR